LKAELDAGEVTQQLAVAEVLKLVEKERDAFTCHSRESGNPYILSFHIIKQLLDARFRGHVDIAMIRVHIRTMHNPEIQ
jgi:hypothetical protein